jgi:hypothetical protein
VRHGGTHHDERGSGARSLRREVVGATARHDTRGEGGTRQRALQDYRGKPAGVTNRVAPRPDRRQRLTTDCIPPDGITDIVFRVWRVPPPPPPPPCPQTTSHTTPWTHVHTFYCGKNRSSRRARPPPASNRRLRALHSASPVWCPLFSACRRRCRVPTTPTAPPPAPDPTRFLAFHRKTPKGLEWSWSLTQPSAS